MAELPGYLKELKSLAEEDLKKALEVGEVDVLRRAMAHIPLSGGKRLRPVAVMLGAEAFGGRPEDVLPLATAVELIHCFTLVHDDIMDQDSLRRGVPTVHTLWGVNTAINAGDALFALAFEQLPRLDIPGERLKRVLRLIAGSVRKVAEGQQMDLNFESSEDVDFDSYLRMVELKTAYLFMASFVGGAIAAGADEDGERRAREFSRSLGVAFQIQDDLLDILADEKMLGKDRYSDIRQGKRSLPIIKALEMLSPEDARWLKDLLSREEKEEADVKRGAEMIVECGAVEMCRKLMLEHYAVAEELIESFPNPPARKHIRELVDFLRVREL